MWTTEVNLITAAPPEAIWNRARLTGATFAERLPIAVKTLVSLVEHAQR